MPTFINETVCEVCGAAMVRHWIASGTESYWLDAAGNRVGDDGTGPAGVDSVWAYVGWLAVNDPTLALYSDWKCRADLGAGVTPWQHWHQPQPVRPIFEPGEGVPYCCGMVGHLIRDGWRCRITGQMLELGEAAA